MYGNDELEKKLEPVTPDAEEPEERDHDIATNLENAALEDKV